MNEIIITYKYGYILVLIIFGAAISLLVNLFDPNRRNTAINPQPVNSLNDIENHINQQLYIRDPNSEKQDNDGDYSSLSLTPFSIREIIKSELGFHGKRSFWHGFIINFIFFILGAFISELIK